VGVQGRGPSECVNCGARLSSGERRCPTCGALVSGGRRQRRCLNCGTPAAQQAKTCLMCGSSLDRMPVRGGLFSVSWLWVGVVALVAALVAVGWVRWREQPRPVVTAPTVTPTATTTPTLPPTATPVPSPTNSPSPVPSPTPIIHIVQSGETIVYIASYYGITPETVMKANRLDEASARLLRPGQELLIPSTGPVGGPIPGSTQQPPQVIYEVQSGETLSSIADQYDTTVEAILAANRLDSPDLIYEGQELIIPLMPPTATPTLTPTPTPTATPGPPYPAPNLLSPANDAVFQGQDAVIVLNWTSVGILTDNQAYRVELETPASTAPVTYTTQGTAWRLPSDLWPGGRRRTMTWRVTVVQQATSTPDGQPVWEPLSLPTETRRLVWR